MPWIARILSPSNKSEMWDQQMQVQILSDSFILCEVKYLEHKCTLHFRLGEINS